MSWLVRLYPTAWRQRYGEEFGAVLASQRISAGLVLDVIAGAIDARLNPQIKHSTSKSTPGDDTMTIAMFARCAAGGPKLSSDDRRFATRFTILSALALATAYIVLTKLYRGAPPVQALIFASAPWLGLVYEQTAYLRKRAPHTQAFLMAAGFSAIYLFMLAVCVVAGKL
jgi:hypothetical protein